ncbi:MAG: YcjX family protein [Aeromonadaceae bacterium]|nr:YcjX family protein [Aeromonadaceae bacterium]
MARQLWSEWQEQAKTAIHRSMDRHLRLAVTGLSRSGKSALITALVHQLEQLGFSSRLDHWEVARSGRLIGGRRVPQLNQHIPSFPFEAGMQALHAEPPRWPEPTRHISELRLELRFHPRRGLLRHLSHEPNSLFLDIVDYPGEWLLDLPLLQMSYSQWSEQMAAMLERPELNSAAAEWLELGARLDPLSPCAEETLRQLAASYTRWLLHCKHQLGYSLIQPGRFVLPGEYEGAPMLQFVPWVWGPAQTSAPAGSLLALLQERYEYYKSHLVRGFYREHFATFDRQIVLVDCLQALQAGESAMTDLKHTLALLMQSFHYGSNNWWRRLFAPRIDKLLFAASKADHVTPDQHANLQGLLQDLVQGPMGQARFENIEVASQAIAAVRAGEYRQVVHEGKPLFALQGTTLDGEAVHLFPGEVPSHWPDKHFWRQGGAADFGFVALRPPVLRLGETLPHLRLDQMLEFLLGDKLQ